MTKKSKTKTPRKKKLIRPKGQAAIDLLLTYGWVLLIIIGIISALTVSGTFNIGFLSSENKCNTGHPINCNSLTVTANNDAVTLDFVLQNIGAQTINITSISFSDENANTCTNNQLNNIVEPGEKTQIITNCQNTELQNADLGEIKIIYLDAFSSSKTQIQQVIKGSYQLNKVSNNIKPTIPLTVNGETMNFKLNDNTQPISQTNPILITTPTDLHNIRHTIGNTSFTHFQLENDIDLSNFDPDDNPANGNWEPIIRSHIADGFGATFNGNGNTISNLEINRTLSHTGLFGYVRGGIITNIFVTGNIESTGSYVGCLVGSTFNATVTNSACSGTVKSPGNFIGGLIGNSGSNVAGGTSTIYNNSYSGRVEGGNFVGGLIGILRGYGIAFSNSSASGEVIGTSTAAYVGGLLGQVTTQNIVGSSFSGNVTGGIASTVGGLMGRGIGANISSSFALGTTNGQNIEGGLVGWLFGGQLSSSFSYTTITKSDGGGLVGHLTDGATCTDSYWDTQTSGKTTSACGTGKPTSELQTPTTNTGIYSNWNTNIWNFGTTTQYPTLK